MGGVSYRWKPIRSHQVVLHQYQLYHLMKIQHSKSTDGRFWKEMFHKVGATTYSGERVDTSIMIPLLKRGKRMWEEVWDVGRGKRSKSPKVQGSQGYLKVTFKYELDSKEVPFCVFLYFYFHDKLKSMTKLFCYLTKPSPIVEMATWNIWPVGNFLWFEAMMQLANILTAFQPCIYARRPIWALT